jgi:CheY-like chemotaxis protein
VSGGPHILVVEDDACVRESLTELLELEGYRVSGARHGEDGLTQLAAHRADLVLLDLHMPVLDGARFLERLRADEVLRDVSVVLMTGSGSGWAPNGLPVQAVLPKPFEVDDLLRLVGRLAPRPPGSSTPA